MKLFYKFNQQCGNIFHLDRDQLLTLLLSAKAIEWNQDTFRGSERARNFDEISEDLIRNSCQKVRLAHGRFGNEGSGDTVSISS